ncbi:MULTISPECIES: type III secretion system export apparatus subunit SctU [Candidatus Ichthyocystis]|uniref:Type III secretion system protein U n=2 Tax=Candidatus Ichthyocystis TaxID=2929841 RepID=A0A0S4M6N9_9BURK|nr:MULTISPECIES: type III secretion system export apparatus subunit SctU [Ichthyocystis]CUT17060.1 type III secretion system protein U [Candidatus Ichthyocystis hellenicum]
MAEQGGEKTEKPTPKRQRDARDEGQVAYSKDFSATILFIAIFSYFLAKGSEIFQEMTVWVIRAVDYVDQPLQLSLSTLAPAIVYRAIVMVIPIVLLVIFFALLSDILQVGFKISPKAMKIRFEKFNPGENLKNIFSRKSFVEVIKSIVKISISSYVVYSLIKANLPQMLLIPNADLEHAVMIFSELVKKFTIIIALVYFVIAIFDMIFQKMNLQKQLMMSMDEIKREFKEMEGDPRIKSKRKQLHREMMSNRSVKRSKQANVVVTNPTHLAVALYYKEEETPLPMVIAKGVDELAYAMADAARESGVPVIQNVPLARSLMERVPVDEYISSDLVEPVAEVIRWADDIRKRYKEVIDSDSIE